MMLLPTLFHSLFATAFLTDPVRVPLTVDVGLLGFAADGAWQLELDAAELFGLLKRLLPLRQPRCGPDGAPADFTYDITYNVVQMRTGLPRLHEKLAAALRPVPGGDGMQYEVKVSQIEDYFERTYEAFFKGDGLNHGHAPAYTVIVINPNRADVADLLPASLRPRDGFSYHYTLPGDAAAAPTQMWLAGRYMVLDLSAGPCVRGMAGAHEGAVSVTSVPEVVPTLHGGAEAAAKRASKPVATAQYMHEHTRLLARLATLVLSAVKHVAAPDLRSCVLPDMGERLVVPLVVLRNHRHFDPLQPGHAHSIDIGALKVGLARLLLPSQETNNTGLRVPFYAESSASPLGVPTLSPTSHALAGLASSLGALVSPFESFAADGSPAADFHWAVGNHPFGPFASASVLPEMMVETARRHATLSRLSAASDLLHDAVRAVEALAARYVHPAEGDSPTHREQIALLHEGAPGGYEAALAHLEEEARGVQHTARDERRHAGREGEESSFTAEAPRRQRVGELLHRLKDGSLSLSSELATAESLRLHAKLLAHEPELTAASAALASGDLEGAHDLAAKLLAAATSAAAVALDEVRGLEAALKCCKIEAARPRSYHLRSVGVISLVGIAVWACVLRLTAPSDKRGQSVSVRPGEVSSWGARFGIGGTRQRSAKEF